MVGWAQQASKEKGLHPGVGDFLVTQGQRGHLMMRQVTQDNTAVGALPQSKAGLHLGDFQAVLQMEAK